jgi:hypothetical protein
VYNINKTFVLALFVSILAKPSGLEVAQQRGVRYGGTVGGANASLACWPLLCVCNVKCGNGGGGGGGGRCRKRVV